MGKFFSIQPQLPRGVGRDRTAENSALPDRRFPKIVTVAWVTLGIASVALALIAALVLRSERESTAILHHLNLVALSLQDVLSDLADAEAEERGYVLTGLPTSLENFQRSRQALGLEFQRLSAMVNSNPVQRQEVERVRYLVQQDLDELQRSITSHMAAGSQAAFAKILTDRARKLTAALRQSIYGIDKEDEGTLARLARERRTRLARALAAVSGALFLAASYLLIGQIMIARSAWRRQKTEAALRASENRFETLCEQAPVGIYSTDAQGLSVYTNSRWSQISGLSAAESLGHGWAKALHPDDRETVFECWKTYARQGSSWEYRLLTPEDKIRWIRALGSPIYSTENEITGYIGTVEDITEQKHAHEELQRERERSAEARGMERFRLAVSAVDPEVVISCREAQICQVLLNLLQNAYDELVDWEGDRWVKLDVAYCRGWVVFSVSDSGPGIFPENRARIMEPFFTTKPVGKGIGLGLSISRSIALEHGGTLELDEQSPHTCFRLKLPISQRA